MKPKYGIISYERYLNITGLKRSKKYSWVKSIIVFAFPYANYQADELDNKYLPASFAKGYDYHVFVKEELKRLAQSFDLQGKYETLVDIDFLNEKKVAEVAGIGQIGDNHLLLTKEYGSRIYLGVIVCEDELQEAISDNSNICLHCGRCIKNCPTKALANDMSLCLSKLTQIDSKDYSLYDKLECYYGCDVCINVCPVNNNNIEYFEQAKTLEKSKIDLKIKDLIKNPDLHQIYNDQAMNWIGHERILRNLLVVGYNKGDIGKSTLETFLKTTECDWLKKHIEYLLAKDK